MLPYGTRSKEVGSLDGQKRKDHTSSARHGGEGGQAGFSLTTPPIPLEADLVVVDEASMADAVIFNSLLKALRRGCRLVLVGDKDQLPSVGAGNVLADVIKSRLFSVNELTHIYRQSEDSYIVTNAHLINSGKMPVIEKDSKDFFFIARDNQEDILNEVTGLVTTRLPKFTSLSPAEIQVLAPMKSGLAGVANLNRTLQAKLNPFERSKSEINVGGVVFRTGDKVMQTVNDYNMEWEINDSGGREVGQGRFQRRHRLYYANRPHRKSGGNPVRRRQAGGLHLGGYADLTLAYAVTVHKSQGSEFDALVVAVTNGPPTILNRNLLYTAVTRAKKTVVLVCSKRMLGMMVKNNYIEERATMLKAFLKEEKQKRSALYL